MIGLTSEQFKLAGQEITEFLTCWLNYIVAVSRVSAVLKERINAYFQEECVCVCVCGGGGGGGGLGGGGGAGGGQVHVLLETIVE